MTKERIKIGESPYSSYDSMLTGEIGKIYFEMWKNRAVSPQSKVVLDKVCDTSSGRSVYQHLTERVDNPAESKVEDYLIVYYNNPIVMGVA